MLGTTKKSVTIKRGRRVILDDEEEGDEEEEEEEGEVNDIAEKEADTDVYIEDETEEEDAPENLSTIASIRDYLPKKKTPMPRLERV